MNLGFWYDLCSKLSCPCEAWPQTPFFPSLLRNPRTWDFPFLNPWELIFEICRWWSFICFFSLFLYIYFWNIFLAIYCCLIFLYHSILTVYLLYCIFYAYQIKCCLAELYFILMIYIPFLSCSSPTWNGSWNKSLVYKVCEELKTVTTWSMVSSQNGFWIPSKQRKV